MVIGRNILLKPLLMIVEGKKKKEEEKRGKVRFCG